MLSMRLRALPLSAAAIAGLAGVVPVSAGMMGGGRVVVTVSDGQNTRMVQFETPSPEGPSDGLPRFIGTASITGSAGENWADVQIEYATIQGRLLVGFNVVNNSDNPLLFTINDFTAFPTINPAEARASASVTVTDGNGDGASLTGQQAGNDIWKWDYNTPGLGQPGTQFDTQVTSPINVGPFDSVTQSESRPAVGFENLGVAVSSLGVDIRFILSGRDGASGTGVFAVVPTPGALALAGIAIWPLLNRRRR